MKRALRLVADHWPIIGLWALVLAVACTDSRCQCEVNITTKENRQ